MNQFIAIGNIVRDPDVKMTSNGKAYARFTIACNRRYKDANGQEKEMADFVPCVAWGNVAQTVGNTFHKGSYAFVRGRFTSRSYTKQDGTKAYSNEITAEVAILFAPKSNNGGGFGGNFKQNGFAQNSEQFGNFEQFGQAPQSDEQIPF